MRTEVLRLTFLSSHWVTQLQRKNPSITIDFVDFSETRKKRGTQENFKLLYDIYHMQIMEGDVIATIRKHKNYIAHYHTGGVPGRHEIDESQELYYPAIYIMKAIAETGFKGHVAQEFIPAQADPLASLSAAIKICDI